MRYFHNNPNDYVLEIQSRKQRLQRSIAGSNIPFDVKKEIMTAPKVHQLANKYPKYRRLINKLIDLRWTRDQYKSFFAPQKTKTSAERLANKKLLAIQTKKRAAERKIEEIATERHVKKIAEIGAVGEKYGWTMKRTSRHYHISCVNDEAISNHTKLIARELRKRGWTTTHSSKCRYTKRITSRYLKKKIPTDLAEMPQQYVKLRLSEHYIEAAEWKGREGSTLGGADGEVVVDIQAILKSYSIDWWLRACLLAAHGRDRF